MNDSSTSLESATSNSSPISNEVELVQQPALLDDEKINYADIHLLQDELCRQSHGASFENLESRTELLKPIFASDDFATLWYLISFGAVSKNARLSSTADWTLVHESIQRKAFKILALLVHLNARLPKIIRHSSPSADLLRSELPVLSGCSDEESNLAVQILRGDTSILCLGIALSPERQVDLMLVSPTHQSASKWEVVSEVLRPIYTSYSRSLSCVRGPVRKILPRQPSLASPLASSSTSLPESPLPSPAPHPSSVSSPLLNDSNSMTLSEMLVDDMIPDDPLILSDVDLIDLAVWFLPLDFPNILQKTFVNPQLVSALAQQLTELSGYWVPGAMAIVNVHSLEASQPSELMRRTHYVGVVLQSDHLYYNLSQVFSRVLVMNAQSPTYPIRKIALWMPLGSDPVVSHWRIHATCLGYLHFITAHTERRFAMPSRFNLAGEPANALEFHAHRAAVLAQMQSLPELTPLPVRLVFFLHLLSPDFHAATAKRKYFHHTEIQAAVAALTVFQGLPVSRLLDPSLLSYEGLQSPTLSVLQLTNTWAAIIQSSAAYFLSVGISQCSILNLALESLPQQPSAVLILLTLARLGKISLHRHLPANALTFDDSAVILGEGAGGTVQKARLGADATPVAVKLYKVDFSTTAQKDIRNELALLSIMRHPNIVRIYGANVEDRFRSFMVMEPADDDLAHWLAQSKQDLPDKLVLSICVDIAQALCHLHRAQVLHRDLKSSNCLVFKYQSFITIKLCDFGCGKEFGFESDWTKGLFIYLSNLFSCFIFNYFIYIFFIENCILI